MKTLFFAVLMVWGNWALSFSIPPFTQPVIDQAGMISSQTAGSLNQELSSIYHSGGPQIAVFTVPSLEDQTIEERAIQVFDEWQIGKKGKDNGVLLLVAKKERKIRIEVGRGLEGDIPDVYAKRIIEDGMVPFFRQGHSSQGIVFGVQQIAHLANADLQGVEIPQKRNTRELPPYLFWLLLIYFIYGSSGRFRRAQSRQRGPFGGWGGGSGGSWGGGGGWSGGGGGSSSGGGASGGW